MEDKDFWKLYSWVKRGKQRRLVLMYLPDKPVSAEEFRKKINETIKTEPKLSLREMSRHLINFEEKKIAVCLSPNAPYGRHYLITELGKKIRAELKEN